MMPYRLLRRALLALGLLASVAAPNAGAQDTLVFRIRTTYQAGTEPGFVVLPFAGDGGAVRAIVRQDLAFSDRYQLRDGTAAARPGERLDAATWAEGGADWLLAGEVTPRGAGLALRVALHDLRYSQVREDRTFVLPRPQDPGFRMAVHAVSDEVVRWASGEPGMAASRIAFVRQGRGTKEVYIVDSDGENLQRVTSDGSIALSPAWSPDGRRIAYTSFRAGAPALYERTLGTGADRVVSSRDGINITPAYSPDGRTLAYAGSTSSGTEIIGYDVQRGCCPTALTRTARSDALSPTFSPDGRRLAFVSNRLGEPHVYVMTLGGEARIVSPYRYGQGGYNTSPDWAPRGGAIAFHTRVGGSHQIATVDASGSGFRVITSGGRNEDPSWAPDARHLVFAATGSGLYVLDTVSGRVRPLVRGSLDGLPDWSPSLAAATSAPAP